MKPVSVELFAERAHAPVFCPALFQQVRDVFSFKISFFRDSEKTAESRAVVAAEDGNDLFRGESVVFSLDSVAVRVLSAEKSPFFVRQFPQYVGDRLPHYRQKARFFRQPVGFRVSMDEQGIVIEHLFKMRNQPSFVRGIPGKAAPDLVVNSSSCHGFQRFDRHLQGVAVLFESGEAHQEQEIVRRGKFWSRAEAAP